MNPDLEKSIVFITSSDPDTSGFGTGFVIHCDEQAAFVLTCQHVVRDVGKEHIHVEGRPATVAASEKEETADDMAVLRVEGLQGLPALRLSICGHQGLAFETGGYCLYNKQYKLERFQGTLGKEVWLKSRGQIGRTRAWELSMEPGSNLQRGYSGAPIIDRIHGLVLGIATHKEGQGQEGLAISIEVLQKIWPDMPNIFLPAPDRQAVPEKEPKEIAPNPFGYKGRITNPENFFDREELLRQIFEELDKGVNISMVGESTVGKSSVLSVILAKQQDKRSGVNADKPDQQRIIQNLRQQIENLQRQWDLISQQLSLLERNKILETRVDEKFRLEHQITDTKAERKNIERQLSDSEAQLSATTAEVGSPKKMFVYLNMEWIENEDEFYDALCDELGIESCRGFKLTRALRGKRYVVCLDEIEKMTWEGFTVKVRSHLRGLADGPDAPLKLVIASRSPLAHLFPDSPELDSPLAGICRQLDVKPFSPEVARKFLVDRLEGTGISFTEAQLNDLIIKTGGHPAKLQDEAAKLYRTLMRET